MWKILLIALVIGLALTLATQPPPKTSLAGGATSATDESKIAMKSRQPSPRLDWQQRFPQLKALPSYSVFQSNFSESLPESMAALIGPINNPYGIRDDILEMILATIPTSQTQMLTAAIKIAYYENQLVYARDNSTRRDYLAKWALAETCLGYFENSDELTINHNFNRQLAELMRNSPSRREYLNQLEQTKLAWQVISSGHGSSSEEQFCKEGKY
jgi:hypothetical protein